MSQPHSKSNQPDTSECSKIGGSSINTESSVCSPCNITLKSRSNSNQISSSINTENTKCKTKKKKSKSTRCVVCNKKLGMMVFHCRCSDTTPYCVQHMRPEDHDCMFDHKENGKEILRNNLPKIVTDKMVRI